jgi:glucosamine-6-phosphate deaminase
VNAREEEILNIPPERLGAGSGVSVRIVPGEVDLYYEIAWTMLDLIERREREGRGMCFIIPVGPVGQYERLARLCNERRLSLRRVTFIAMDEYMTDESNLIPYDHPLSFRRHLDERFYGLLDPELAPPRENRVCPDPDALGAVVEAIDRNGGVDMCIGGVGITGHLAFNDPPEDGASAEEFAGLGTRVVRLALETRVINSVTAAGGNIAGIPGWAVTVGMREILGARSVRIFMNRPWQPAVVRRWLHGPVTAQVPASLLQRHPDVRLTITEEAARLPAGQLR